MPAFLRPMIARDPNDHHRAATPLELFFDLVSVIAIAAAAVGLHHSIIEAHALQGTIAFLMAFFAIWWAWMNYTWFASAYDNDDALFRLITIWIMGGSLTMAAGIADMFSSFDLSMIIIGYVIMRFGMIALWVRAAKSDPDRRKTALTYAYGIGIAQIFWLLFLVIPTQAAAVMYGLFILGVALELAVPALAERNNTTPWHRHHIIERYGLLNIIVLGETLLAGAMALQQVSGGMTNIAFVHIALSSLVIVFSMWWLYFSQDEHLQTNDLKRALTWGYGHYVIFASGAAVGAGFAVLVDIIAGKSQVSLLVGDLSVAVPVAIYMLGLWFVRDRFNLNGNARLVLPVFAVLVLLVAFTPLALEGIAAVTALSVIARSYMSKKSISQ